VSANLRSSVGDAEAKRAQSQLSSDAKRLKVETPEGEEYTIPQAIRGKYIVFPLHLDLTRDWTLIQLIYSLPPRTRSRMIRDMLRIVVNAAHIWLEKQPTLHLRHGKKLTAEQRRKLLRTKLGLG